MAIAFEAASAADQYVTAASSLTFAHTITSSTGIILVGVRTVQGITGVTYNGEALTQIATQTFSWGAVTQEFWYRIAPATGTHNVVISASASGMILGSSCSYTGVDQTTPLGTPAVGFVNDVSTPFTVNVSSATGELVVDTCGMTNGNGTTLTAGASQTRRVSSVEPTSGAATAQSEEAGAATVTMSWTHASTVTWCVIGVSLKPASAGGVVVPILMAQYRQRRN
jgi:hypothetical protein